MKTTSAFKLFALALLCACFTTGLKAQTCSFYISNATSCPVNVTINYYTNCSTSPTICKTITTSVPTATIQYFSCTPGCSGGPCDVQVTVNSIGGNTVSGATVNRTNVSAAGSFSSPGCAGGSSSLNLVWTENGQGATIDLD